ncbi:MAG TPA: PKD domain-containing protein [Ktedonobacterales bacterium]|nr:PKD domain-containing protein [Ktedonobacterales bacterium]
MIQPESPVAPVPPPPPPLPATARLLRMTVICLLVAFIVYLAGLLLPVPIANEAAGAYPPVHAVISGASVGMSLPVGQPIHLSALRSSGKHLSYHWRFGDGTTSDGPFVTISFAHVDPQMTITLTASDPLAQTVTLEHRDQATIIIHVVAPATVFGGTGPSVVQYA